MSNTAREIPLSRGAVATIDDEDYEAISAYHWHLHSAGYAHAWETRAKKVFMHRLIANAEKGQYVDHVDGNRLNNRRSNLRIATASQNAANSRKRCMSTARSRYKGVVFDKQKSRWMASIRLNYRKIFIGYYDTEEEAAVSYNQKAKELFGEYARLNDVARTSIA